MKNEKHPIDDLFKDKLNNASFDLPSGKEASWNRLQVFMEAGNAKAVNEERQRKAFAFWPMWAAASISLLCIGGLVAYYQTKLPENSLASGVAKKVEAPVLTPQKNVESLAFSTEENEKKKDSLQSATPSAKTKSAIELNNAVDTQQPVIKPKRTFKSVDSYKKLSPTQVPIYIAKDKTPINEAVALTNEDFQNAPSAQQVGLGTMDVPSNLNTQMESPLAVVDERAAQETKVQNLSTDDNLEEITVLIEIHPGHIRSKSNAQVAVASTNADSNSTANYVAGKRGKKLNKNAPTTAVKQFFASLWRFKQGRASSDDLKMEGKRLYATFQNDNAAKEKPIE